MTLRDKTNQKFKNFFEKISKMHKGEEFELAFSEIQRETGAANITMKRAIESLEAQGWFEVKPGRNSRYARFKVISQPVEQEGEGELPLAEVKAEKDDESIVNEQFSKVNMSQIGSEIAELESLVESLRRRIRTQEMTIALLQERVAEIEDKLYKR